MQALHNTDKTSQTYKTCRRKLLKFRILYDLIAHLHLKIFNFLCTKQLSLFLFVCHFKCKIFLQSKTHQTTQHLAFNLKGKQSVINTMTHYESTKLTRLHLKLIA